MADRLHGKCKQLAVSGQNWGDRHSLVYVGLGSAAALMFGWWGIAIGMALSFVYGFCAAAWKDLRRRG